MDSLAASSILTTRSPAQPSLNGFFPGGDAVHEVCQLLTQRLELFQLRRPHIAGAVIDQQFVYAFAVVDVHAFVVDLDLLVVLKVVPHQHSLLAADQRGAHLHRRQPVHVDVRDDVLGKVKSHERDVFVGIQVALPGCHDGLRAALDHVIHDGKIVRSKIPQHVDIVLEKPQIDAGGIVVIELAQSSFASSCEIFLTAPVNRKVWSTMIRRFFLHGDIDQLLALRYVAGERLLDKHVFAVFQSRLGQFIVSPYRGNDGNGVDVGRGDDLHRIGSDMDAGVCLVSTLLRSRTEFSNGCNLRILEGGKITDNVWPPITVANYTEVHGIVTTLSGLPAT